MTDGEPFSEVRAHLHTARKLLSSPVWQPTRLLWARLISTAEKTADESEALAHQLGEMQRALEPFVAEKMPSSHRTVRDYDEHGLRRIMSPMEIARKRARAALRTASGDDDGR